MTFQVAGALAIGDIAEWRLQLVGRGESVSGTLQVEASEPAPPGETPIYIGRIKTILEDHRKRLDLWLAERTGSASKEPARRPLPPEEEGSTTSGHGDRPPAPASPPAAPDPAPQNKKPTGGRDAISAALKVSVARVQRTPTPKQRALTSAVELPGPDRWHDVAEHNVDPTPSRPAASPAQPAVSAPVSTAVSAAVSATVSAGQAPVSAAPASPVSVSTGARAPQTEGPPKGDAAAAGVAANMRRPPVPRRGSDAPHRSISDEPLPASIDLPGARVGALPTPQSGEPAPPQRDPSIAIRPGTDPLQLRLTWHSQSSYNRDYVQYLRGAGLFLPLVDPAPLRTRSARIALLLVLPSGKQIACVGEIVAPMSQGAGVALQLTNEQRAWLAQESETLA